MQLVIEPAATPGPGESEVEIVERKGLGHPDTICDALAEAFSRALCREYERLAGQVLHHNVDKTLLAAGVSAPRFGGGRVLEPMRVFLAGRAVLDVGAESLSIADLAEGVARSWFAEHLHALDAQRHVAVSTLVRPGSAELTGLFEDRARATRPLANDSSCGVGYAPLSEVERLVLAVERRLNSAETRASDPALGEDVKVMAVRRGDAVHLLVACAMIDGALRGMDDYVRATERVAEITLGVARATASLETTVDVNAADDVPAGRIYLTVTGTSGEAGDDGQAGRGNRVNGLITPGRPMTIESVAGKNPVTHVGKLYNVVASLVAQRLVEVLPEVRAADCRMVSAIGRPIDEPVVAVRLDGGGDPRDPSLAREVAAVVGRELDGMTNLAPRLARGDIQLDRWPLESS